MRYGAANTESDIAVRRKGNHPSIDCILQRHRLIYLRRLLCHAPPPLQAALHIHVKGKLLPWTQLIVEDL
eukprot:5085597-Karenia_brevis.AAC.1